MKDIRKTLEEVAELAERTKDQRLHRIGRPPKPEGEVGQIYSIRIPVARILELERMAAARGEAPRTMLRKWVIERLDREARSGRPRKKAAARKGGSAAKPKKVKASNRRRRA
jgi:hypothetical protein